MAINLEKGQKVDLTKGNEGLSKIKIGLGWDTNKYDGGHDFDLDACIGLLNGDGKASSESNFVYFSNKIADGVKHNGDNLTGEGDGDDEVIEVDLNKIKEDVNELAIHVVIYKGEARDQNFGQISNTFVRIENMDNSEELLRFDMGEDFSTGTRLCVGKLYRHNGEWKFQAVGEGSKGGFPELLAEIGLEA